MKGAGFSVECFSNQEQLPEDVLIIKAPCLGLDFTGLGWGVGFRGSLLMDKYSSATSPS